LLEGLAEVLVGVRHIQGVARTHDGPDGRHSPAIGRYAPQIGERDQTDEALAPHDEYGAVVARNDVLVYERRNEQLGGYDGNVPSHELFHGLA
jgi:hypothetical protein